MRDTLPLVKDLVLIGGGHTHALVLRMWGMNPLPGVRLTLINPGPVAPYTGMLPGHIAGHYTRADMMIDLIPLARFAGARVILDRAIGIDRTARRITLAGRAAVSYDIASLDIGITSDLPEVAGFADHAAAAKPLGNYSDLWAAFVATAPAAPRVTLVGAGVGGVELALATAHRLRATGRHPQITLIERAAAILAGIAPATRSTLTRALHDAGIMVLTNRALAGIQAGSVTLDTGDTLPSDFTLSVAGTRPQGWLTTTGLDLTDGFVTIGPTLQSSDPAIFATGDCAHLSHAPRPKAGVFAVRQAPILLHNLRCVLSAQGALHHYNPQRDYLKLISMGGKTAVADTLGLRGGAAWQWRWKDHIDRAFMDKFARYPVMANQTAPALAAEGMAAALGAKPLCGGCGAKVSATDLTAALDTLPLPQRADVLSGPGDDAAIMAHGTGVQVITTDHLRAFTHDAGLMARITAIHALGDIWAMGAAPQAALAQITLPRMAPQLQAETLREIMAAATPVFRDAGADVVGGHTSIGAELTVGFTVTGLAPHAITKSGARAGDLLILTKPIGTGTVLAAEMSGTRPTTLLLGEAVAAALTSMSRGQGDAAALLAPHAHAMTDVTGFGLAGHLLEMLDASRMAATLHLGAIRFLPGAVDLAAVGVASSLAPANRNAAEPRLNGQNATDPRTHLLFDPQTAGGLLASVAPDQAATLLAQLRALGFDAAIIGHIQAGSPHITLATG